MPIRGSVYTWTADGRNFVSGDQSSRDIINLDELRATVERARKMRAEQQLYRRLDDHLANQVQAASRLLPPARPTPLEALEDAITSACNFAPSAPLTQGDFVKVIQRARRASEGL